MKTPRQRFSPAIAPQTFWRHRITPTYAKAKTFVISVLKEEGDRVSKNRQRHFARKIIQTNSGGKETN